MFQLDTRLRHLPERPQPASDSTNFPHKLCDQHLESTQVLRGVQVGIWRDAGGKCDGSDCLDCFSCVVAHPDSGAGIGNAAHHRRLPAQPSVGFASLAHRTFETAFERYGHSEAVYHVGKTTQFLPRPAVMNWHPATRTPENRAGRPSHDTWHPAKGIAGRFFG